MGMKFLSDLLRISAGFTARCRTDVNCGSRQTLRATARRARIARKYKKYHQHQQHHKLNWTELILTETEIDLCNVKNSPRVQARRSPRDLLFFLLLLSACVWDIKTDIELYIVCSLCVWSSSSSSSSKMSTPPANWFSLLPLFQTKQFRILLQDRNSLRATAYPRPLVEKKSESVF